VPVHPNPPRRRTARCLSRKAKVEVVKVVVTVTVTVVVTEKAVKNHSRLFFHLARMSFRWPHRLECISSRGCSCRGSAPRGTLFRNQLGTETDLKLLADRRGR
jgi:hypothetical protein